MDSLDLLDLACPKPLLYTKKKLEQIESGSQLEITLNSEKNLVDVLFFLRANQHQILSQKEVYAPDLMTILCVQKA